MMIRYANIDNYSIGAIVSSDTIEYVVCDRNMQRYTAKTFKCASEAIVWAFDNFKGLEDEYQI